MPPNVLPALAPSRGIISQPSMSAQLMRAQVHAVESEIWMEDEREVWKLVKVVSQDNTILVVKHTNGNGEQQIDLVRQAKIKYSSKVRGSWTVATELLVLSCVSACCPVSKVVQSVFSPSVSSTFRNFAALLFVMSCRCRFMNTVMTVPISATDRKRLWDVHLTAAAFGV